MDKIFLVHGENEYTYQKLITDLNKEQSYKSFLYVKGNNPYKLFLFIIHSLIYDYSIEVLDGDFSESELEVIGVNKEKLSISNKIDKLVSIIDIENLLVLIEGNKKWNLVLYTSGTTGRPKKVSHNFKTLTRNVKVGREFSENIWAFAYNPTHMAGLQVFFQALMNQNTIIYSFDGQHINLPNLINKYNITNISATPTFYRNLLPYVNGFQYESIKRVTFGGEIYDYNIQNPIINIFPNAKIINIYASTEAGSLFVGKGDIFEIPNNIRGLVKVNENNELLIHQSLLGNSASFSCGESWYETGDLVEWLDNYRFRFSSRKTDLINVGGYKVNPIEVENTLIRVPGIIDLLVRPRENRVTGQILVIDVVKDDKLDEMELKKTIKKIASEHLQEWKIPRIIKFVEHIPRTRTGKKVRK